MAWTPGPPGGTPASPSSTSGSFYSPERTKQASVFMPGPVSHAYLGSTFSVIPGADQWLTPTQAKRNYSNLKSSELNTLASTLAGIPKGYYTNVKGLWNSAVDASWAANQNGQKLSPWDIITGLQNGTYSPGQLTAASPGGSGPSGPRATSNVSHQTQTQTNVSLTNKTTSDRLIDDVLSTYLGHTASDTEKANFLGHLNAAEKANPTVSTQSGTTKSSNSGGYNSTSTSSATSSGTNKGGVDSQEVAIQAAKGDKGYAEYQYGTTYMNAFLSALGAPVSASGTV